MESSAAHRPALSWRKKTCFALLTTILGLGLMEGLLAVSGITPLSRSGDPFVGFDQQNLFEAEPGSSPPSLRTRPQKLPWFNDQTFAAKKPDHAIRIFCLGGSTTYGRPYQDATSFCGQLRKLLQLSLPNRKVEVINAGGVSYASYRIERLGREVLQYEPDALVIYTGHNEFLEQRTYAPLKEMSRWQRTATSWAAHTHIYSAMHQVAALPLAAAAIESEVNAMLDGVVGLEAYQRDDQLHRQVFTHFQWNLQQIARQTSAANIPLVLVAPASNLADISPFKSQWQSEGGKTIDQAAAKLARAQDLIDQGNPGDAVSELEAAIGLDDRHAGSHFLLAGCLLQLGQPQQAKIHFQRALEEDVCPVRARPEFVNAIRQTANQWQHIALVDFESMLQEDCQRRAGHHCLGDEYFLDHVHPAPPWHGELAVAIAKALASSPNVPIDSEQLDKSAPQMHAWADRQLTPQLRNEGLRNLAKVMNWAGKHERAGRLAVRAAKAMPEDAEAHLLAAPYLFERGEADAALRHARLAVKFRPDLPDTHRLLGQILAEKGDWAAAAISFVHWTREEPDNPEAWAMLGGVQFQQQQWNQAVKHLKRAESLGSSTRDVRFQVAAALHQAGKNGEAESRYRAILKQQPNDIDALFNFSLLLTETNREAEAIRLLRKLLTLERDAEAEQLLQQLESP